MLKLRVVTRNSGLAALMLLLLSGCASDQLSVGADYSVLGKFGEVAASIDAEFGLEADIDDWANVQALNCNGARAVEFDGYWAPDSMGSLPADQQDAVALRSWAGSLTSICPDVLDDWEWTTQDLAAFAREDARWKAQVPVEAIDSEAWPSEDWEMGIDGDGTRVQCADGEWSNSGGKQGACSHHGGVG